MVEAAQQLYALERSARHPDACENRGGPDNLAEPIEFGEPFAAGELEVAPSVRAAWNALAPGVRHRVAALFARPVALAARAFEIEGCIPEDFARDLACGGCGFRVAFPMLARRVVAIMDAPPRTLVRVVCRGEHVGPFFALLSPTERRVQFDVKHHLVLGRENLVEDSIDLDLRALVLQLAGRPLQDMPAIPSKRMCRHGQEDEGLGF